eukprot:UN4990
MGGSQGSWRAFSLARLRTDEPRSQLRSNGGPALLPFSATNALQRPTRLMQVHCLQRPRACTGRGRG